ISTEALLIKLHSKLRYAVCRNSRRYFKLNGYHSAIQTPAVYRRGDMQSPVMCAWARDMKKRKPARTIAGSLRLTPSCLRRHFQSPNLKQAEPENHSVHLHGNENCICCTALCDW